MSETADFYQMVAPEESRPEVSRVEIRRLRPGPRLRLGGINHDHLGVLVHAGGNWPPVLVRRCDHSIVDGYYRYLAARQLGHTHLDCVYFEAGPESAFLEALRRNLHHGLPLSLRDREVAGQRLLTIHPKWSDRRLGELCGLSPGTVSALRRSACCSPEQNEQVNVRWGRDGKRYPVAPVALRALITDVLRDNPEASLRSIARTCRTSPATVRAVKARLVASNGAGVTSPPSADAPERPIALLCSPMTDAALLSTNEGALFAEWFERTSITDEWRDLADGIPLSRVYEIADEARRRAGRWLELASVLEGRAGRRDIGSRFDRARLAPVVSVLAATEHLALVDRRDG